MPKKEVKTFVVKDLKVSNEDGKFYLTGYANTKGREDSHGDIPHSLNGEKVYELDRMKNNPVCFVDHNQSASSIAGNFVELAEDEKGLRFKLLMRALDSIFNPKVKDAVSAWMEGFGRAFSIGGYWFHGDPENSAHLTKAVIYEISLVGVGSDGHALAESSYPKHLKSAVPFQDLPIAPKDAKWNEAEAVKRIMESLDIAEGDSLEDEGTQEKFRKAFLICDQKDVTSLSSYRLPVADIVAGKMSIIPFAVMVSAGAVASAEKDFSEADLIALKKTIGLYYEKLGLEHPFVKDGCFRVDDISTLDERVLEKMLKCGIVKFNSTVAKTIVSRLKSDFSRDGGESGSRDDEKALIGLRDSLQNAVKNITKEI